MARSGSLRLFTDFDGPIMDVSERYYQVYLHCVAETRRPDQPVTTLSKAEFWALKRDRVPEVEIARRCGFDEAQATVFARLRRDAVHTDAYFPYDCLVPGAVQALEQLQDQGIELVVMTMRRVRELEPVLEQYDLARFFAPDRRYCLANDYVKTGDTKDKPLLMGRALTELPAARTLGMVGDTEADMLAATTHGLTAIGVLSGIRNREQLAKYSPQQIVPSLAAAANWLLQQVAA